MGRLTTAFLAVALILSAPSCASFKQSTEESPAQRMALSSIHGFQTLISPVDGDRCMMLPSCSAYAGRAVRKHGVFMGWIMTCDRLLRCGHDELYRSEILIRGGQTYCLDPVENNDFWWYEKKP